MSPSFSGVVVMDGGGESLELPDRPEICGPGGEPRRLGVGESVIFGRGPGVDLLVGEDLWTSRRVGELTALTEGVRVVNLSRKQPLLVLADGDEPVRLPPALQGAGGGYLLRSGSSLVGSATMMDQRKAVRITLPPADPAAVVPPGTGASTEARVPMRPETRGFAVALLLCRPWLVNPARTDPLPTVPELARLVLDLVSAEHLLRRIERSPDDRRRVEQQIKDHIRTLRDKLRRHGLVALGHTGIASNLLHFSILDRRHLALLKDPHWLTIQENNWWNCL